MVYAQRRQMQQRPASFLQFLRGACLLLVPQCEKGADEAIIISLCVSLKPVHGKFPAVIRIQPFQHEIHESLRQMLPELLMILFNKKGPV